MDSSDLFADAASQGRVLVFDGAVGTELYERGFYINRPFEELSASAPGEVLAVHRAYVEAGAHVLTTNTFSITRSQLRKFDIEHRQAELLLAGLRLAREAVGASRARVGFSIGPIGELVEPLGPVSLQSAEAEFREVAELAVASNIAFDLYILESFTSLAELESAVRGVRAVDPRRPVMASLSLSTGASGLVQEFARRIGGRADVNALGFNCSEGPSQLYAVLKSAVPLTDKPIIVQPNAGIPRQINGRYFYMTSPDYLGKFAKRYAEAGAAGVGGCCGTGAAHVAAIAAALRMRNPRRPVRIEAGDDSRPRAETPQGRRGWDQRSRSKVGQALRAGRKVVSVEMTSPKGLELERFLVGLELVRQAGVEFVNVPDGPRAATRVSSLHLAAAVRNRTQGAVTVIPHFTARDRNLIALQADLLGAAINGVHDVLLVTGDPPKLGNNKQTTGVYDIDSIGLTHLADRLNAGVDPNGEPIGRGTDFGIGVAANPTAANLELELQRWRYKVEMGADFAVTQPVYDPDVFRRWIDRLRGDHRPHLVGIWPFISLRNAEFMANEVPGVHVPAWALEEMAKAGPDKEEAVKRGIGIAQRVMASLHDACEGFCVSAPLGKVDVALAALDRPHGSQLKYPIQGE